MTDAQPDYRNADAFICVCCKPMGELPPHVPVLLLGPDDEPQWPEHTRAFLTRHARTPSTRITAVCPFPDDHPGQAAVVNVLRDHQAGAAIGQHTLEQRAEEWGRHFIANLTVPAAVLQQLGPMLRGATAIVVGAGPSLDHVGPLLRSYQDAGAFVIAVNTAVPACLAYGFVPDLVCSAEAKPEVAAHMSALPPHVPLVLDVFASPATWALPNPKIRSCGHEPNIVPYMLALGGRPCSYTGSVTNMAVAVAIDLGATTVALAGFDCGYGSDGAVYAKHTPFDGLRATEKPDGLTHYDGSAAKQRGPMPSVQAQGTRLAGRDVLTEHALVSFAEWLAKVAQRRTVVSIGSHGLHIPCVVELEADGLWPFIVGPRRAVEMPAPIPAEVASAILDRIELDARTQLAGEAIYPTPGDPLLNLWVIPKMLEIARTSTSPGARVRSIREAFAHGCREVIAATQQARESLRAGAAADSEHIRGQVLSSEIVGGQL